VLIWKKPNGKSHLSEASIQTNVRRRLEIAGTGTSIFSLLPRTNRKLPSAPKTQGECLVVLLLLIKKKKEKEKENAALLLQSTSPAIFDKIQDPCRTIRHSSKKKVTRSFA
jgi:hypothetical protein